MINRRQFVRIAAVASAASTLRLNAAAETATQSLPPAIAALKSMKSQATPISTAERAQRVERARELMSANKLDAILLTGGTSTVYFTAVKWWVSERFFGAVLPARGKAFSVCPAFEVDRLREQLAKGPLADAEIYSWQEDENPYQLLATALRKAGIASGTMGIEERVQFVFSDELAHAAPALKLVSATPVTAGCRMVKSEHELQLMTVANRATLAAYEATFKSLKPGMTQHDAERFVTQAHQQLGFDGGASVQVGKYSALPHGSVTPQEIGENTIVMMDGGCDVEGYNSDITRTFVLGKPSDKMQKVFDVVHRAQAAALAAARHGVECQAVDRAARSIIEQAGFGPDYKFFSHRVGHGIGMDGHEWPYLVRGNTLKLAPGMCFSDEPGIYIPGEFGVRLEDDMHITDKGAELFTPQSPSLEEPFAK